MISTVSDCLAWVIIEPCSPHAGDHSLQLERLAAGREGEHQQAEATAGACLGQRQTVCLGAETVCLQLAIFSQETGRRSSDSRFLQ